MRINKIILAFPPAQHSSPIAGLVYSPPLGISYLASSIEHLCKVYLFDLTIEPGSKHRKDNTTGLYFYGVSPEDFRKYIEEIQPDMIGLSCLFSGQINDIINICRIAKTISSDILTVIGGTHPTFFAQNIIENHTYVDYILLGEAEESLSDLISKINLNKDISDIDGIVYREGGSIVHNLKTKFIKNLDELKFPARNLLNMERYFKIDKPINSIVLGSIHHSNRVTTVVTSRGCPYNCRFCSSTRFWGQRYRYRSAENVLDEMQYLKDEYKIEEIQFVDDNLTVNRERAMLLFKGMINRKLNIHWCTPNGIQVSTLDSELLELMKESGCYELNLAIESGNQGVLDNIIRKPLHLSQVNPVIEKCNKLGIRLNAFFMIGLPGEKINQIKETLKYARQINVHFPIVFKTNPLAGSEVYDICKSKGLIKEGYNLAQNDYFKGGIDTLDFSKHLLDKLTSRHFLIVFIRLFFKNPIHFIINIFPVLIKSPFISIKHVFYRFKDAF